MGKEIVKEYKDRDLTIVWKPHKCIHSGICTGLLPDVYKPEEKPWIKTGVASTQKLKDQINQCPSGALTYYMNNDQSPKDLNIQNSDVKIKVENNGPLVISGEVELIFTTGDREKHKKLALCRCGNSGNKPFCDGSHNRS